MSVTVVHEPTSRKLAHECDGFPEPKDAKVGTIVQCDGCARQWVLRSTMLGPAWRRILMPAERVTRNRARVVLIAAMVAFVVAGFAFPDLLGFGLMFAFGFTAVTAAGNATDSSAVERIARRRGEEAGQ